MELKNYKDYEDFTTEILEQFNNYDIDDISIIAKYDEAKRILMTLFKSDLESYSIDIHEPDYDEYNEEYIISIYRCSDIKEVYCEPMLRETGYLNDSSDFIYVLDNCSSKVLKHIKSKNVYEVSIGEDEDNDDGDIFHYVPIFDSECTYKVNGEKVDKCTYIKELEKINNRCSNIVRRNILDYCEFMDEVNELLKIMYF